MFAVLISTDFVNFEIYVAINMQMNCVQGRIVVVSIVVEDILDYVVSIQDLVFVNLVKAAGIIMGYRLRM